MESTHEDTRNRYGSPSDAEVERLAKLSDETAVQENVPALFAPPADRPSSSAEDQTRLEKLFVYAFNQFTPKSFAELVGQRIMELIPACEDNVELKNLVLIGLERGIREDCPEAALQLGAMYYGGEIVAQDYQAARDLYALAMSQGNIQATINLGYVYEYGRTGTPDQLKAYQCYSYAAALANAPEALYKRGDIYARGKLFAKDMGMAFQLWKRCLDVAQENEDLENQAQAAIRIAPYLLDERKAKEAGVETNPLTALQLYQLAEIGLRISIENGLDYYRKRLRQAIEGQQKARLAIEPLTFAD